jgi:uncharacterized protein YjcR
MIITIKINFKIYITNKIKILTIFQNSFNLSFQVLISLIQQFSTNLKKDHALKLKSLHSIKDKKRKRGQ